MHQQVQGAIPHDQVADGEQMTFHELLDYVPTTEQGAEGDGLLDEPVTLVAGQEQR